MHCACRSVGKPGNGAVTTSRGLSAPWRATVISPVEATSTASAAAAQEIEQRLEIGRDAALQGDFAAGDRGGDEVGPGLDAVGDHAVGRAVQGGDALQADRLAAGTLDVGAHLDQQPGEIDDLGFARAVLEHRLAAGERRRHEQILGPGDGRHGEAKAATDEMRGADVDIAVLERHLGAEGG